jgi:hypothetical protein
VLTGKLLPPTFGLFMQQMRLRAIRRLPIAFGWLTLRGDAATARWTKPVLTQPEIRHDTVRVLRAVAADTHLLFKAAECLPSLTHAALVVRASRDRAMPPEHLKESLVKDPRPWRWCESADGHKAVDDLRGFDSGTRLIPTVALEPEIKESNAP